MYHHSITYQVAQQRQLDMIAAGRQERRARQSRPAAAPRMPRHRSSRRWQLVHQLRPAS